MGLNVTPEEQAKYRELNRLRMKIYRDKNRERKYSPRKTRLDSCVQSAHKDSISVPESTEGSK